MKKALTLLLAVCMIFTLVACGGKEPAETKPAETQPTEPATKEYVLLCTKTDIMQGMQMTPTNMEVWLEEYTTTDEAEAKNAIRASQIETIEYMWTKEAIPGGTILTSAMFTTQVPDGVIPDSPTEGVTYDNHYIGVIDKSGMYVNVSANDITSKFTGTGRSIKVTSVDIMVTDRADGNDKQYTERLTGEYNLKQNNGTLKFSIDESSLDSLGLFSSIEMLVPALVYSEYSECGFSDPIVTITANLDVDGKQQTVVIGGTFAMTIDPNSGLTAMGLLEVVAGLGESGIGGLLGGDGSGLGWLEGLFGGGAGLGDLFGG